MKALALVDATGHVCCRYRIRAFQEACRSAGIDLRIEALERGLLARTRQLHGASRFDTVILQRRLLAGWQFAILRRAAARLVFDFDDAVLYRDSYDPRGPHCPRRRARFARTVQAADLVLAGNSFLRERAIEQGARPDRVRLLPTCVDPATYPLASHLDRPSGLRLAWIGSSSTLQGLERQRSLLDAVGQAVPGARLRLICDRPADLGALAVDFIPWSQATEAAALAECDVGISWVPDDLWSRGKCGLKVLQYQAAGLPVVANPVGVHTTMVRTGRNGFLAESAEEWVHAARELSAAPELRSRLGLAARQDVEAEYSVNAWADLFVSSLRNLRSSPEPAPRPHTARPAERAAQP